MTSQYQNTLIWWGANRRKCISLDTYIWRLDRTINQSSAFEKWSPKATVNSFITNFLLKILYFMLRYQLMVFVNNSFTLQKYCYSNYIHFAFKDWYLFRCLNIFIYFSKYFIKCFCRNYKKLGLHHAYWISELKSKQQYFKKYLF